MFVPHVDNENVFVVALGLYSQGHWGFVSGVFVPFCKHVKESASRENARAHARPLARARAHKHEHTGKAHTRTRTRDTHTHTLMRRPYQCQDVPFRWDS